MILAAFVVSLVKNWLATREILAISRRDVSRAVILAGLNASADFIVCCLIVIDTQRIQLAAPIILGNCLSTWFALRNVE